MNQIFRGIWTFKSLWKIRVLCLSHCTEWVLGAQLLCWSSILVLQLDKLESPLWVWVPVHYQHRSHPSATTITIGPRGSNCRTDSFIQQQRRQSIRSGESTAGQAFALCEADPRFHPFTTSAPSGLPGVMIPVCSQEWAPNINKNSQRMYECVKLWIRSRALRNTKYWVCWFLFIKFCVIDDYWLNFSIYY